MSILHVSGGGGTAFERSTNLPSPNATMACCAYLTANSPGFSAILSATVSNSNPANYVVLGFNNANSILTIFTDANVPGEVQFLTLSLNTWYVLFLRMSATSCTAHAKVFGSGGAFTSQTMVKTNFTPSRYAVATDYFGDPVPAMRTSRWVTWAQTLTEANCTDFAATSWSLAKAQQYGTVDSYATFATIGDAVDTSGNARTIAALGSAGSTAAEPPFPPDSTPKRLIRLGNGRRLSAGGRLLAA